MKRAIVLCSLLAMAACVPVPPPPPPPPPPPMAGPAGARVFTVYFGWNRSWVGPHGYTDTSGSVPYNQRLSERRARHVADVLFRMGVPAQAMAIGGVGENNLAVPTADGVREPRNRRVTVVE